MFTRKMNLEDYIYRHLPVQDAAQRNPNAFGIEVELEGKNILSPPDEVSMYWGQTKDGSLRVRMPGDQATEYVTHGPMTLPQVEKAITALFSYLTSPGVKVYESYRTSIHVHVNFGVETFRTIYNFITLSLILDELLVSQNGEHRIGNNFCLRARDALGQVEALIKSVESGHNFFNVPNGERYSSINFASLTKFGSIEFRSLECTTHEGRLMHWIGTLARIKECAKTFKNPTEVIQSFSMLGPQAFLTSILGPYTMKYSNVLGMESMLFNGMRIAQDFAYCSAWNEVTQKDFAEKANNMKPKKGGIHIDYEGNNF